MMKLRQELFFPVLLSCLAAVAVVVPRAQAAALQEDNLRLGIIGTDTSHVIVFTAVLNDPGAPGHISGATVVAAFKGGSQDIAISRDRVEGFAKELREKWHVRFVDRITEMCPLVDGILLESVDGRAHLEQFRQALTCGKPIYVEKPLASTLADAKQMAALAAAAKVPWFSSSPLRFGPVEELRTPGITGAMVWGPGPFEENQQLDLAWYAIHSIEILFTVMGPDVQQVTRTHMPDVDVLTGIWSGNRVGTVRAIRPYSSYGIVIFREKENEPVLYTHIDGYIPLVKEIVKFIRGGIPPVSSEETLAIYSFMDGAQQSLERGGIPVNIAK
jgi:Oxidoreductase family, NAD-binding Rossmann fold